MYASAAPGERREQRRARRDPLQRLAHEGPGRLDHPRQEARGDAHLPGQLGILRPQVDRVHHQVEEQEDGRRVEPEGLRGDVARAPRPSRAAAPARRSRGCRRAARARPRAGSGRRSARRAAAAACRPDRRDDDQVDEVVDRRARRRRRGPGGRRAGSARPDHSPARGHHRGPPASCRAAAVAHAGGAVELQSHDRGAACSRC